MIYKTTSINSVLSKIIRDHNLGDQEIPLYDFIDWIAEAMQHIGGFSQYETIECDITIKDYKGKLPSNFYKMVRISSYQAQPIIDNLEDDPTIERLIAVKRDIESVQAEIEAAGSSDVDSLQLELKNLQATADNIVSTIQYKSVGGFNKNTLNHNAGLVGYGSQVVGNSYTSTDYNINLDTITTSFADGTITIQYLGIPVDSDGFPLIPDDVAYRDAIFWYVTRQLSIQGKVKNKELSLQYCEQQWQRKCGAARAEGYMPDLEQMYRLSNIYKTLKYNPNQHESFYTNLGKPEILQRDNARII